MTRSFYVTLALLFVFASVVSYAGVLYVLQNVALSRSAPAPTLRLKPTIAPFHTRVIEYRYC